MKFLTDELHVLIEYRRVSVFGCTLLVVGQVQTIGVGAISRLFKAVCPSVVGALLARNGTGGAGADVGGGCFGLTAYSNTVVKRAGDAALRFGLRLGDVGHEKCLHLHLLLVH